MTWEHEAEHAGFSNATPWLPVKPAQAARAVDTQDGEGSVLAHYRRVLSFYRSTDALRFGGSDFLDLEEPVLAFWRDGASDILCLFNMSSDKVTLNVQGALESVGPSNISHTSESGLSLPPHGFGWLLGDRAKATISRER